ncbi:hypothetical protein Hanom_Chr15g01337191 [Helianthus anomalus]
MDVNGFSVMDFDASIKTNSLVGSPLDLYPPENICTENCTTNQQNEIDPGRVLPSWSKFSPQDSLNRILDRDYGITDAQKNRILEALTGATKAVRAEEQEDWTEGEYDFFYDKCLELGLDPDFCVEDVYDDESGSAQFLSQLSKTGKFFDPVVLKVRLLFLFCLSSFSVACWDTIDWSPVSCGSLVAGRLRNIDSGSLIFFCSVESLASESAVQISCCPGLCVWVFSPGLYAIFEWTSIFCLWIKTQVRIVKAQVEGPALAQNWSLFSAEFCFKIIGFWVWYKVSEVNFLAGGGLFTWINRSFDAMVAGLGHMFKSKAQKSEDGELYVHVFRPSTKAQQRVGCLNGSAGWYLVMDHVFLGCQLWAHVDLMQRLDFDGLSSGKGHKLDQSCMLIEGPVMKPSDKAAGLQNAILGLSCDGSASGQTGGPQVGAELNGPDIGPNKMQRPSVGPQSRPVDQGQNVPAPSMGLMHGGPSLEVAMDQPVKSKGSGFFDVSKQDSGLGPTQVVNTKNSFGSLCDEVDCFDTDLGLWENEIEIVKKFVESNTCPKIEDYDSWSANMKIYYDGLTKMNEDDEVASETDETARFMKSGVKS